jgi:hypothetical protein
LREILGYQIIKVHGFFNMYLAEKIWTKAQKRRSLLRPEIIFDCIFIQWPRI